MSKDYDKIFESYFNTYYNQVYLYVLSKVSNISVAEDLVMDSFVACYQKFNTFDRNRASFATWIYVVVNNRLKNYYRDKKIFEEIDDNFISDISIADDIVAAQYLSEMRNTLADALNTLSEIQKKIVIYKYFQNKNANEISLILGLTAGNVRVQLSRALQKLQSYFKEKNIEWEF